MKRVILIVILLVALATITACSISETPDEAHARSVLSSAQASYYNGVVDVDIYVDIEEIEHTETQTIKGNVYKYFLIKTSSHEWGFAELKNGTVRTFKVGLNEISAKRYCEDYPRYRATNSGSMFE